MKSINIFVTFLFFVSCQNVLAQEPDPLSFFPHSVGNVWEYDTPDGIRRYEIIRDSIGIDSSIFIFFFYSFPSYRIDTAFNVYDINYFSHEEYLQYKLDADSGDYWIYYKIDPAWWFAFVAQVNTAIIFGEERIIKKIEYGFCRDTIYEPDYFFVVYYKIIAEGLGLIYEWNEEPPQGPQKILRGCIIDGDTIGIITTAIEDLITPKEFTLLQNYPNPFNPETTIEFQIPVYSFIELKVFDLLGQEIAVIINEEKPAGRYEVRFNGTNLSSGIYIYILKTKNKIISRKMILLR
jgi:hypothetical protein